MESFVSTTTGDDVCSRQRDCSGPSTTSQIFRQDSSSITERDTRVDSKDGSDDDELGDACFDKVSEGVSSGGEVKEDCPRSDSILLPSSIEEPEKQQQQNQSQLLAVHPIDLPSLTPSKSNNSTSDSDSDSIPDGFTDINDDDDDDDDDEDGDDEDVGRLQGGLKKQIGSLNLNNQANSTIEQPLRTPANLNAQSIANKHQLNSFSEPLLSRNRISRRKRSLSELVALRYRGGKGESEIGDEERGLLALDLGAYINSGDPDLVPETKPIPPSGLFPTLENLMSNTPPQSAKPSLKNSSSNLTKKKMMNVPNNDNCNDDNDDYEEVADMTKRAIERTGDEDIRGDFIELNGLPKPPPRSEWPFGGTGPGKTSRGFIPGRRISKPTPQQ
ncbi:hypothetical protein BY996DRAFT_4577616 [Phakopsora pachyrhizi]|nr:hypothetical protein BY996DRAFT_4577616 [Phakopsora pachyrhizi]